MEQFWTDNKVAEFVNQYCSIIGVGKRYEIEKLLIKFKEKENIVFEDKPTPINYNKDIIRECIAKHFNTTEENVSLKGRRGPFITYKQIFVYFLKTTTTLSNIQISDEVGYKRVRQFNRPNSYWGDNSSIICACNTIRDRVATEPKFREDIEKIRKLIVEYENNINR